MQEASWMGWIKFSISPLKFPAGLFWGTQSTFSSVIYREGKEVYNIKTQVNQAGWPALPDSDTPQNCNIKSKLKKRQ